MTRVMGTSSPALPFVMILILSLLSIAGTPVASRPAAGGAGEVIFPYPYQVRRLPNGLTVILAPYDSPGIVAYYTAVRVGSRVEIEEGKTGFAHLFEHMMFRGTRLYPGEAYNQILLELGIDNNAFTTDDWTCYTNTLSADRLDEIIRIEADRFINLTYTEETFRKEAGAVLGEYNKDASNPNQILYETLMKEAFTTHTYRHTTMGFLADIRAMPGYYEHSLEFYHRHYRPGNTAVIVVGDFELEPTFERISTAYSGWEPGHLETPIPPEPPQTKGKEATVPWESPTLPYLVIGWHVPGFSTTDPTVPSLEVIGEALFSPTAPLYQKLVLDEQIVESISAPVEMRRDPYLFVIEARAKREEDLERVRREIETALAGIAKDPISGERLEKIRSHIRNRFLMNLDTPGMIAVTLGDYFNLSGDPDDLDRYYRQFDQLTPKAVSEVVRKYLTDENRTVVTLMHRGG